MRNFRSLTINSFALLAIALFAGAFESRDDADLREVLRFLPSQATLDEIESDVSPLGKLGDLVGCYRFLSKRPGQRTGIRIYFDTIERFCT